MQKSMPYKILAYIPFLFIISLFSEYKSLPSVRFHCGQGMLVTALFIISGIFGWLPLIGWLISSVCGVAWLVYMIIGIINVCGDRDDELPLIGRFAFFR